jgi:uncharacterized DUF497 family protein
VISSGTLSEIGREFNVRAAEATTAFGDPLSLTVRDLEHSENEERFLLLGMSTSGRGTEGL